MSQRLVRRWEGRASREGIETWLAGYRERVLPAMKRIDGCLGAAVHVQRGDDPRTVTVLTYWDGARSLEEFAGPEIGSAVIQDWVADLVPDCDRFATHYDEVLVEEFS